MSNIGLNCDVCGRTVQGCTFVNGMKFCAKCYQETFGNNYSQTDIINAQYTEHLLKENAQLKEKFEILEQENKQLKEQLAKKDKEVEQLRKNMEFDTAYYIKELVNIRKQVCEKIFEEIQENVDCYFEERKYNSPHSQLPYIWFNEIRFRKFLDQIEKGELKDEH